MTITLMLGLIANNVMFMHSHYLSDGTIITHAHPFKKSADSEPIPVHSHSKAELLILENLQVLIFFFFTLLGWSFISLTYLNAITLSRIPANHLFVSNGRSPPVPI
jgi:hypothetical protein